MLYLLINIMSSDSRNHAHSFNTVYSPSFFSKQDFRSDHSASSRIVLVCDAHFAWEPELSDPAHALKSACSNDVRIGMYSVERGLETMRLKATIGICVRNCEAYIAETIESVRTQDYPHNLLEIIFIDDGSTDNTLGIIKDKVTDIDISTRVFSTTWKGIGHARNLVVENAHGDYVVWVDGDMIMSKDFVGRLVDFMDTHPHMGIVKGKQALEQGRNLLATLETYARAASRMVDYESEKSSSKSLGTGGSIYRTEIIRDAGGFDEHLRGYGEDFDAEIRVRAMGYSLSTIDPVFYDYERRGLSWKSLWERYWLRGYFSHYFLHKNTGMIKHHRMFPPASFLSGILQARKLFKLTHQKSVFVLPFQYFFKTSAWYFGYVRSHLDSYHPAQE